MNYVIIVAGGSGSRIKSIDIPKQYYEIDGIAIINYSLKKMLSLKLFDKIYITINKNHEDYMKNAINDCVTAEEKEIIKFVHGGIERIDSIHNTLEEIRKESISEDDIVVIHDAARPFVSSRILLDNIDGARKHGVVVTAVPSSDTVLIVEDGLISDVPNRKNIYREQTPTSSNLKKLLELEAKLTEEERKNITGTAQIFTINNYKIKIVDGSDSNFKITTDEDLERAKQKIEKGNV